MARKSQAAVLQEQLVAKKTWRKKRAALPMSEKVKVLEKLRERNCAFRAIRKRRKEKVFSKGD
jgi:hypothetical protein